MTVIVLYALVAVLVSLVIARRSPEVTRENEWGDSAAVYPMALLWPITLAMLAVFGVFHAWSRLLAWYAPPPAKEEEP